MYEESFVFVDYLLFYWRAWNVSSEKNKNVTFSVSFSFCTCITSCCVLLFGWHPQWVKRTNTRDFFHSLLLFLFSSKSFYFYLRMWNCSFLVWKIWKKFHPNSNGNKKQRLKMIIKFFKRTHILKIQRQKKSTKENLLNYHLLKAQRWFY